MLLQRGLVLKIFNSWPWLSSSPSSPSSESERLLEALQLTRIKVMMSPSGVTICLTGTQASVDTHAGRWTQDLGPGSEQELR